MSEDGFPRYDPAGKNFVLRTGLGGTQSATIRVNQRSAYRNLSSSILHSALIIFHSSPRCALRISVRDLSGWRKTVVSLVLFSCTKQEAPRLLGRGAW